MTWSPDLDPTTAPYGVIMSNGNKDKVHWTQTEEGRKRMAKLAKSRHSKKRRQARRSRDDAKEDSRTQRQGTSLDHHAAYIFGKVETIIEYYARSVNVPFSALADGVAGLLRHKEVR